MTAKAKSDRHSRGGGNPISSFPSPPVGGDKGRGSARVSGHAVEEGTASAPLAVREGSVTPYLAKPQQPRHSREGGNPVLTFGDLTEQKVDQGGPPDGGEFVYVDISSVDNKLKRIVEPKTLPAEKAPSRARQRLRAGDVLVSMTRPNLNAVAIVPSDLDGSVGSTGFHVLRARDETEPKWLFHAVQSPEFVASMSALVQGALYPAVRPKDIRAFELEVPPLTEQRRIVAELETQLTRLDASVTALKRVQASLKRYRASVLKAACEGRLVTTEAELARREGRNFESGDELLRRLERENRGDGARKKKKSKQAEGPVEIHLPDAPEGWAWATVEELAAPKPNSITDGPFGSNLKTEHYVESGPRVIRLQNIGDGKFVDERAHITGAHFNRLAKHRVFADDLVIAAMGESPPRSCIVPDWLGPAIVKADCVRFCPASSMSVKYLNCSLNAEPTRARTKSIVHGVGRPRLNLGEIRSISLPLPPAAEQHRIVAEVERCLSVSEELEVTVAANLKRAERLRQATLAQAFAASEH